MAVFLDGRLVPVRQSARELGVSFSYLSRILSGTRDILLVRVELVQRMATLFGFATMEDFLHAVMVRRASLVPVAGSMCGPDGPEGDAVTDLPPCPPLV